MIAKDLLAEINYDNVPDMSEQIIDQPPQSRLRSRRTRTPCRICGERLAFCTTRTMIPEPNQSWSILWDTQLP